MKRSGSSFSASPTASTTSPSTAAAEDRASSLIDDGCFSSFKRLFYTDCFSFDHHGRASST
ncbi:hypothetical protein QJS04_geneDACA009187 [Acorus gramineus]|uniref:Uncharacterized protein n=1 Tax=Acorus gramineus TaxID=55184 RepID=A0AAV9ARM6_ACOGR|nr:hypothetical protein QJS04_geneDACA009187 [Acorus gramineus]